MTSSHFAPDPYPGLRPFTRDEQEIFFGRDEQTDQLLEKLKVARFLTVIGPSGCGKSSLVRAGMIADLEGGLMSEAGAHWEFVEMRPGNHPISALADALLAEEPLRSRLLPRSPSSDELRAKVGFLRAALRVGPLGLVDVFRQSRLPDHTNFLLLVDQFEEIFVARNEGFIDETDAFVALLLATAAQRELPLYVVVTMRSDYLGNCPVFSCLPEAINQGQYLTPRLDREQRTEAIVGPAKLFEAAIDADLVNHLLNEAGPSPDQLPVLQHLLMRMWTLASHDGAVPNGRSTKLKLTFDHYTAAGGFEQAISKHAGEAYSELTERQKEIAQVLFRALCERGPDNREKRRPVAVETIAALAETTSEEVIAVADVFRRPDRSFIMPPSHKALAADMVLDISHEALIRNWDKLNEWVGIEAKSAENYLWLEQAARRWKASNREGGLFDGFNLKTAVSWQQQEKPSRQWAARYGGDFSLAMEFLSRSQENYNERLRHEAVHRRNVFLGAIAALVGGLVVACGIFSVIWQKAAAERRAAAEVAADQRMNVTLASKSQEAGDDAEALAYLARALGKGQGNYEATAFASTMLAQTGWALPVTALIRDSSGSSSAQFSPDGKWLATGSKDGIVRLWDLTAKDLASSPPVVLRGHKGAVVAVGISPRNLRLVTGSKDGTVLLWDLTAKDLASSPPVVLRGHEGAVVAVAISPDNLRLVTGSEDKTARLWDARTGKPIGEPMKHGGGVSSAQFSPDGRRVVTACLDSTARIWDAASGNAIGEPMQHRGFVTSAEFSPDGQLVVTASLDGTARLWDAKSGKKKCEPMKHGGGVSSARFSPDGQRVVTASADGTARVWDAATPEAIGEPIGEPLKHLSPVNSAHFSSDGELIVTASEDGTARLWDAASRKVVGEPMQHVAPVDSAQFSPDGDWVMTESADGIVRIWDAASDEVIGESMSHEGEVISAKFSPDGQRVVTASGDRTARIWNKLTGKPIGKPMRHVWSVNSAQFSPDGRRVVTACLDWTARIWDAASGNAIGEPMQHRGFINSAEFSPDGQLVVTASLDKTARVWDAKSGKEVGEPMKHAAGVNSARFSRDGKYVVTASVDTTARLWDAKSGKAIGEPMKPMKHGGGVSSAQFSPDGRRVVTACLDWTARIWDAASGKAIGEPMQHRGFINSAEFSPDGQLVVTASLDGTARLWNAKSGKEVGEPMKHAAGVNSAEFSPDSQRVVTASADGTSRIWDAKSGEAISGRMKHVAGVNSAQFGPDGQLVVTASQDGTARLWAVPVISREETAADVQLLAALCEATGGLKMEGSTDIPKAVTPEEIRNTRNQIGSKFAVTSSKLTPLEQCLKWSVSERRSRTISPFSETTLAEWEKNRIEEGTLDSLRAAVQVDPTNARLAARFGRRLAEYEEGTELAEVRRACAEANFQTLRALNLAPDDDYVKRLRDEVTPRLQLTLGLALTQKAKQTEGAKATDLLTQAVAAYRSALNIYTREAQPQDWAQTQWNLGNVLHDQGIQTEGTTRAQLLGQAVAAYRSALEVYTRDQSPEDWAQTQSYLGVALWNKASALWDQDARKESEVAELLVQAEAAYRSSLEVYTRDQRPQDWAQTENNLGVALSGRGRRSGGEEGRKLLEKAIAAYESALEVRTKADSPQGWAQTQNNLSDAFSTLANQLEGQEGLKWKRKAVVLCQEVMSFQPDDLSRYRLANVLGGLAFSLVLSRQFAEAQTDCEEAQRITHEIGERIQKGDRDNLIFIQGNLAHALLFQNHYDEALAIYIQNWSKPLNGKTFREVTLDDFDAFHQAGLTHPDLSRMEEALKKLPAKAPSP